MTVYTPSRRQGLDNPAAGLTAGKTVRLVAFATFIWFCAAMVIQWRGSMGIFIGVKGIVLFAMTIPFTIPLNWIARKIASLPAAQMVTAIAVTSATALALAVITSASPAGSRV